MNAKFFSNNKAQFFIASAIIIIISISIVFFYLSTINYSPDISIRESDISFFANNIKEEFDKVAELTLSNVSSYLGQAPVIVNPTSALEANLSNFSRYAIAYAAQKGVLLNVSYSVMDATNTTMNASVNLTFYSENAILNATLLAYSKITVDALNGTLTNQLPTGCTFNTTVKKEYNETVTNLSKANFIFLINGSACSSPTYSEGSPGKYNFTCTSSGCAGSTVVANVTDLRNIVSWSAIPNTGSNPLGVDYGCAATCGQAIN